MSSLGKLSSVGGLNASKMSEVEKLTQEYWSLREEVRKDEGRLQELQTLVLALHNVLWK